MRVDERLCLRNEFILTRRATMATILARGNVSKVLLYNRRPKLLVRQLPGLPGLLRRPCV